MKKKYPKGSMADRWARSTLILEPKPTKKYTGIGARWDESEEALLRALDKAPLCHGCKHFEMETLACVAFPDGVPMAILGSAYDHREPYPGDNGVMFEPLDHRV